MPRSRPAPGVAFILATMLLDRLVVGILSPVPPPPLVAFSHGRIASASEVLGVLSDRYVRRPVILLSSAGAVVG